MDFARKDEGYIRLEPRPWLDPFPSGTACVRWWGDLDRARAFQEWASQAIATLRKHVPLPAGIAVEPGYHSALQAFVQVAKADAEIARHVKSKTVLEVGVIPQDRRQMLPFSIQELDPPPVFTFEDVRGPADQFAFRVMGVLTGEASRPPRLVVDVEAKSVTLDGKTHYPGDVWVRILYQLVSARGRPINRRYMKQDPILKMQDRLDRDIKSLKSKLKIDIQSSSEGYSLPEEYWA